MKVFISWSGGLSHKIAIQLRDWLPSVIQSLDPYVSSEDIEMGTRWSSSIGRELESAEFGIICVTPQNLKAPWINFEAGALSKAFDTAKVCPFLFGLHPSDLGKSPLLEFQSALYNEKDVLKLLTSINNALGEAKLEQNRLEMFFQRWWNDLQTNLDALLPEAAIATDGQVVKTEETSIRNAVEELLGLTREQHRMLMNGHGRISSNREKIKELTQVLVLLKMTDNIFQALSVNIVTNVKNEVATNKDDGLIERPENDTLSYLTAVEENLGSAIKQIEAIVSSGLDLNKAEKEKFAKELMEIISRENRRNIRRQ